MKISFRQGIVRRQSNLTAPDFLRKSTLSGTSIDLIASPDPTVITFAHYSGNYLFEEGHTITGAWGGDSVGSVNGPLTASGQTQYLFWDVNLATGELTRGWTLVPPIITPLEPTDPVHDTHWFDTTNTRMRVFRKPDPTRAGAWQDKIRLFAASYDSSANIIPMQIGSQVGITGGEWSTGNIILGANNKPLKQSDGTFVTTESDLIIYQTSGQNVKFDMTLVYAQASEDMPKFSLVSFQPDRRIGLASSNNVNSFVSGIILEDLYQDEVGQIVSNGVIRNEQWDWTAEQINKPLFCGPAGEIRLNPPIVGVVQQVGYIYEQDSIYLNIFAPVRLR
jgi:hypothetical protein